jgi:uncharacterized membrane protein YheB (UPF0754 family)
VIDKLIAGFPELATKHEAAVNAFVHERLGIEATFAEKLRSMSKPEFEAVLRGIFEEDEWILITLGGFLGGAIGMLQGAIVLAFE